MLYSESEWGLIHACMPGGSMLNEHKPQEFQLVHSAVNAKNPLEASNLERLGGCA